jgi:hypothetical protein
MCVGRWRVCKRTALWRLYLDAHTHPVRMKFKRPSGRVGLLRTYDASSAVAPRIMPAITVPSVLEAMPKGVVKRP